MKFALVAGEASGDLLGAGLIEALRARFPNAEFAGIGGDAMRAAGMDTWFDASELAVMGLTEVLAHLPRLLRLRRALRERVLAWRPDAFVGIDAPDFNLGVERWLKQRGVRTVHYVSPSVWAWRQGRAAKIGRSADRVLCLFPMEPPIYARHGVDARFVGHPLADTMALEPDRAAARAQLGLPAEAPVLAVLPGSRLGEIARLGADFLQASALVAQEMP
ncbi:MAG TPA: lipid-A-disaccharide synthase, partial [Xanthomonadaceae bacterium]|nr:lipid-A-disaccharide synthase [Xanthomonadaceae bacterium]